MPSAGTPIATLVEMPADDDEADAKRFLHQVRQLEACANTAMAEGFFTEWLESFVGAWNQNHDVDEAMTAGLIEWDL